MSLTFAALGLDHRHIYGMSAGMIATGAHFATFWTDGAPRPLAGFIARFPTVNRVKRVEEILEDAAIDLVLIAAPPAERAALSIRAMEHGKDVMLDKPGCLDHAELTAIRDTVARTGRIWSVNFSERFEVPAVTCAEALLNAGEIGKLVQTVNLGPHRLNAPDRPDWFWNAQSYGGILGDIGTHQIDQFLHFAGAEDAQILHAAVDNMANPQAPDFQDFGEVLMQAGAVRGYARLDWFTPDALPSWGDGRLTLLGTEGYIELRKYVDPDGRPGGDHLFLVNGSTCRHIDAREAGTPYFERLAADICDRTETAVTQRHTFKVMELAIAAQAMADVARVRM